MEPESIVSAQASELDANTFTSQTCQAVTVLNPHLSRPVTRELGYGKT